MTLLFRSKVLDQTHGGNSLRSIQQRGIDWNTLRNYENEDIRDIAWSRSSGENIYVKSRQNQGSMLIIGIFISGSGDSFFRDSYHESKQYFLERAKESIDISTKQGNYTYQEYSGTDLASICNTLHKKNTKNTLILVFGGYTGESIVPGKLIKLSGLNDIVMIDVYHPFDIHPFTEIMFDGKTLTQSSLENYKKDFDKKRKEKSRILSQSHVSHIEIETSEDIENRLNYFFKERYHG